jgi:excinuclease ABC subunit C
VYAVPGRDTDDRLYLVRHGRVVGEARCAEPDSVNALQALESKAMQPPTGAMVDQLDELLLVESWFRGRNGAVALVADTVVGALEKLAAHVRTAGLGVLGELG